MTGRGRGSVRAEAAGDRDYAGLVVALATLRNDRLGRIPSDRALAQAAKVSTTTVRHWLRGERFPQAVDPLLAVVHAVRVQTARTGLAGDPAVAVVLDKERWRKAFRAEAARRSAVTGRAAFGQVLVCEGRSHLRYQGVGVQPLVVRGRAGPARSSLLRCNPSPGC